MQKEEVVGKIDEAVELLYQNKEKQAIQKVADLLPVFYEMIEKMISLEMDGALQSIHMMKELMENYDHFDMIGMADCLLSNAYDLVQMYAA